MSSPHFLYCQNDCYFIEVLVFLFVCCTMLHNWIDRVAMPYMAMGLCTASKAIMLLDGQPIFLQSEPFCQGVTFFLEEFLWILLLCLNV